jgi:hypothetical protein
MERRSDCGHFGLVDWSARQDKMLGGPCIKRSCDMVGWFGDMVWRFGDLASGESMVRPLLEGTLGRGVNLPGSAVFARGRARARRDRVP